MKIFRNAFEAGKSFPGSVLAIGKFDGMHRGHQAVIRAARREADRRKAACLVLTFDPSPDEFLRLYPDRPLLPMAERIRLLKTLRADAVVLLPFDRQLACVSPAAFAKDILAMQLKPAGVCVGADFCFGRDRAGRVENLKAFGDRLGFSVRAVPLVLVDGEKITAFRIRGLIDAGERRMAQRLLGWKLGRLPHAKGQHS